LASTRGKIQNACIRVSYSETISQLSKKKRLLNIVNDDLRRYYEDLIN
jgi:hypothetical protein